MPLNACYQDVLGKYDHAALPLRLLRSPMLGIRHLASREGDIPWGLACANIIAESGHQRRPIL